MPETTQPSADGNAKQTWVAAGLGIGGLVLGLLIGAGGGSDTKTITETHAVVRTETRRVPVVRIKRVTKIRRVVHVKTVTVQAAPEPVGQATPDTPDAGSPPSDYAGMNCSEIGHSFEVTPGSDPEHDADNDGIACESYG